MGAKGFSLEYKSMERDEKFVKPEVYSCLKMLESLKESCDDSAELFEVDGTLSTNALVRQYDLIRHRLEQHLGEVQVQFIPSVDFGSKGLAVILELSSAAGIAIAYLRSLDGSLEKELEAKKRELTQKEKELASLQKILEKSLAAVKELPEVQRSAAVAEWKKSHREIELHTKSNSEDEEKE